MMPKCSVPSKEVQLFQSLNGLQQLTETRHFKVPHFIIFRPHFFFFLSWVKSSHGIVFQQNRAFECEFCFFIGLLNFVTLSGYSAEGLTFYGNS